MSRGNLFVPTIMVCIRVMIPSALAVDCLFSPLKSIGSHGSSLRSLEDNVILPPQKFWYPPLLPAINNDMPLERICFSLTQRW